MLKASIENRLRHKGIDQECHVDDKYDKTKELRKKKTRGLHNKNKHVDDVLDLAVEQINEELLVNSDHGEHTEEIYCTEEQAASVSEEMVGVETVEGLDESFEREDGGNGRRVLPSRTDTVGVSSISPSSSITSPQMSPVSTLIPDPVSSPQMSPLASLLPGPNLSRNIFSNDSSHSTRGKGKGGLNLRVLRGRITKEPSKQEEQKKKKILWKQWLTGFTAEVNEVIKNHPRGLHIVCEDCGKNVSKQSYLRHRTVNGCSNFNPRIKFFNWD